MVFLLTPNLIFLSCLAGLALILLLYLILQNKARENIVLLLMMVAVLAWSAGSLAENSVSQYAHKLFWFRVQQSSMQFFPLLWLAVLMHLLGQKIRKHWAAAILLTMISTAGVVFLWTNENHRLFWDSVLVEMGGQSLAAVPGPLGLINIFYNTGLAVAGAAIILRQMPRTLGGGRMKYLILLYCTLMPLLLRLAEAAGNNNSLTEITNLVILAVGLVFAFGMFYYRLFGLVSIPAHAVITGMQDGILVLDQERMVVQANPTAEAILAKTAKQMLGQPMNSLFSGIDAHSLELMERSECFCEKIALNSPSGLLFYEVRQSEIREQRRHPAGWLITLRDVTSQVQAENESRRSQEVLQQSEEKFRSLVENINELIFIINREGTVTYVSPAVRQITGYEPQEIIGNNYREYIYPDDLIHLEANQYQLLGERKDSLEFRILNLQSGFRHIRVYPYAIKQDGVVVGVQGVITDITERKQVEIALERRASQLAMLNFIGERIAEANNLDGLLNSAVQLIQQHFGYYHVGIFIPDPRWNMLIMRASSGAFSDLFPENHRLMLGQGMVGWAAEHKNVLLAKDVRLEPRFTNLYPDKIPTRSELAVPIVSGETLMGVLDIQSPMIDAFDDNDVRVMETVADQLAVAMDKVQLYEEVRLRLEERERSENMLRVQRDLLFRLSPAKSLQETLEVALETLSTELHASQVSILLAELDNQRLAEGLSLGYPLQASIQLGSMERSIPGWVMATGRPAIVKNASTDPRRPEVFPGTLSALSVPLISSSRAIGVVTLESALSDAFSQEDQHLLTTLANSLVMLIERARLFEEVVTARAELERRASELLEANTSLREMDHLKSQFLANMSHELRTPLNSIIGFSEVLIDGLIGQLNAGQNEAVQDILDSGTHLLVIINDLLDFSKISAGRMPVERVTFDVDELFDELGHTILPLAQKKQQQVVFQKQDQPIQMYADRLRIKQVLLNLLSNANKFTGRGGQITVSCQVIDGQQVQFSVCDTGIGIRPEDQQLIFEEFRQVDGSMSREAPGTGLGLSISKKIVEFHQGKIWVESEAGKGSTFRVCLPVHSPAEGKLDLTRG